MAENRIVTFGCRLNAFESEVIRRAAADGRARRRDYRQHLRRHRRGRAPGAPGDPARSPRSPRGADHRHRLRRRRLQRSDMPRCPRSTRCSTTAEKLRAHSYLRGSGGGGGSDLDRERGASGRRLRRQGPRLSAGPAGLRPPLHLLHHPLCPRPQPLGADRGDRRTGAPAGRRRLSRDRADRRRSDRLWRRSAGRTEPRPDGAPAAELRCPNWRGCVSPRSTRSRSTPICGGSWPRSRG